MKIKIVNLEDNRNGKQEVPPHYPASPVDSGEPVRVPEAAVPPPAEGGTKWWTCGTTGCRVNGYVATADAYEKQEKYHKKCTRCQGSGWKVKDEVECGPCEGKGWTNSVRVIRVFPHCPLCDSPMVLVSEGGYPTGYPRLDLGEVQGNDYKGGRDVGWRWHPPS